MENNNETPEFMFIELQDQIGNALRVEFDGELIDDLVDNKSWLEVVKPNEKGEQHFIFPAEANVIRSINWLE